MGFQVNRQVWSMLWILYTVLCMEYTLCSSVLIIYTKGTEHSPAENMLSTASPLKSL